MAGGEAQVSLTIAGKKVPAGMFREDAEVRLRLPRRIEVVEGRAIDVTLTRDV